MPQSAGWVFLISVLAAPSVWAGESLLQIYSFDPYPLLTGRVYKVTPSVTLLRDYDIEIRVENDYGAQEFECTAQIHVNDSFPITDRETVPPGTTRLIVAGSFNNLSMYYPTDYGIQCGPISCPAGTTESCGGGQCYPSSWIGDGECDAAFNCSATGYDGGDCSGGCPAGTTESCGGGQCYSSSWIGDGQCDAAFNCSATGYDGGDCSGGGDLELICPCSYEWEGDQITLSMSSIDNGRSSSTGALAVRLWATSSRYSGGSIQGYVVGELNLDPLPPGYYYSNVSNSVSASIPPNGSYYFAMTLIEGGFIQDYVSFDGVTVIPEPTGFASGLTAFLLLTIAHGRHRLRRRLTIERFQSAIPEPPRDCRRLCRPSARPRRPAGRAYRGSYSGTR